MDTTATKDGDIPDMNGEDYDEEEEAGSGDDSDDVCPTFSVSRIWTYCIRAGCRNHYGTHQPLTRFPVRFFSFMRSMVFVSTAPGAKTVLKPSEQVLRDCLKIFQRRHEVRLLEHV